MTIPYESRLGILPEPREFTPVPGACDIRAGLRWHGETVGTRVCAAMDRLSLDLQQRHTTSETAPRPTAIQCLPGALPHHDAYHLNIRPETISVTGGSPAGCYYAIQTLGQLIAGSNTTGLIPCCDISDWPDFDTRGLLHDVTRGKVPTLTTLKLLVDRLTAFKGNQLQLNIEHAFVFEFDPAICGPDEGLTADEVRELDGYCSDRFVDLIPAVATFGHMGRILSMPKYRHLAECEATATWKQMDWAQRARGLTLDCATPEAQSLVERIWSDILDAFSSPAVNICGDEPHDLGRGKNQERFRGRIGEVYLGQIRRVQDICTSRGRRVQFWSDVVVNYPDLFDMIAGEATVLHWGYDDNADYASTSRFTDAGLPTIVCPGTSGWKRVLNAMNLAERNIAAFAKVGKVCGTKGLLNTDWGDHGHFNLLACSWHGIALGAVKAWRADHVTGTEFDSLFAKQLFGLDSPDMIASLRRASEAGESCMSWQQLWTPIRDLREDFHLPLVETTERAQAAANDTIKMIQALEPRDALARQDLTELYSACEFVVLWAGKMRLVHKIRSHTGFDASAQAKPWRDRIGNAWQRYRACWLARNKTGGLADIDHALSHATDDILGQPW